MEFEILIECDSCHTEVDINTYDEQLELCSICKGLHNLSLKQRGVKAHPVTLEILDILECYKTVLSIDIGIQHLGLVLSSISDCYAFGEVLWMELVDITLFTCDRAACKLHHDRTFTDWTSHVLEKYREVFTRADYVLIERQPPQGLVVVEQILFGSMRDKSVLISPNSVHKFFGIGQYSYENRKIASVNISKKYIPDSFKLKLQSCDRIHDIADCILFTVFWCEKKKEELEISTLKRRREDAFKKVKSNLGMSLDDFFDMYRYIPTQ
jgi:hypothetical protein